MGFKINLNNISVPSGNQFKVFYKLNSRTPGNVTYQGDTEWGTYYGTYTGGTTTDIEIDFDLIDPSPFGKQHWFKILDTVTGSYIIENIHIHEYEYYYYCDHCCDFSGGTASYLYSCDFGGTAIYNSDITITPTPVPEQTTTPTPTPTEIPGEPAECSEGMDVVFLVDYTGSMGSAINGIKTSISNIANTIVTESNNNYRLGLVLFDEWNSQTISNYSNSSGYTSLPSSQKYVNVGLNNSYQWITAVEMMQTNNQTSFTTQLNKLNTSTFPLGYGVGGPEPADMGIDLVGTENFVGTFRSGVSKLIIIVTDNVPSGNDDNYTQTDIDFVNTLTPQLFNQNIRVLLMTTTGNNVLYDLATGTNGLVSNGFTGTDIITAIENICVPT